MTVAVAYREIGSEGGRGVGVIGTKINSYPPPPRFRYASDRSKTEIDIFVISANTYLNQKQTSPSLMYFDFDKPKL